MQFLQQYWWCVVSILCAILVMLLFVQGGMTYIFQLSGKDIKKRTLIANTFGRKWGFSLAILVLFIGAFFASFPKFYSVSFGGATYLWIAILITFFLQAVSYELRNNENKVLGTDGYDVILTFSGFLTPILIGVLLGTFFFGANFYFRPLYLTIPQEQYSMVSWDSAWHGLESFTDPRNILLGLSLLFLSRSVALLYMIGSVGDEAIIGKCRKTLKIDGTLFLIFFISFVACLLCASGVKEMYDVSQENSLGISFFVERDNVFLNNFISLPFISTIFIIGLILSIFGICKGMFTKSNKGICYLSSGAILMIFALLIVLAWNGVSYYYSLASRNYSLTIANSSSSMYTLQLMQYISYFIPIVLLFALWVWKSINKSEINND